MTSTSLPDTQKTFNYDEVSMQQGLLFSDSLKDLKNLGSQLYSAAEYFELSYTNDDQKQIVVDTLKDYAIKALVNTVDHLGSVTYKVNDLLDEKVDEVSGSEQRVSCIEQRLRTCQEYIDHEGLSQQSLIINTPKYHKRYVFPAVQATIRGTRETPRSAIRKGRSPSPTPRRPQRPSNFSFTGTPPKKELEKRTVSPHQFPPLRYGSFPSRLTTPSSRRPALPNSSRPTTPNASAARRYPSEPQKSSSVRLRGEKEHPKDIAQYASKSKGLLKSLLSRRKSKNDDMLYTYLDEY